MFIMRYGRQVMNLYMILINLRLAFSKGRCKAIIGICRYHTYNINVNKLISIIYIFNQYIINGIRYINTFRYIFINKYIILIIVYINLIIHLISLYRFIIVQIISNKYVLIRSVMNSYVKIFNMKLYNFSSFRVIRLFLLLGVLISIGYIIMLTMMVFMHILTSLGLYMVVFILLLLIDRLSFSALFCIDNLLYDMLDSFFIFFLDILIGIIYLYNSLVNNKYVLIIVYIIYSNYLLGLILNTVLFLMLVIILFMFIWFLSFSCLCNFCTSCCVRLLKAHFSFLLLATADL